MEENILTNLPVGVLELITKDLSIKDYLALRAVCRSCRKIISYSIKNKHCCHLPEMPQVFQSSKYSKFFFSLSKNSLHHYLATPPLRYAVICNGSIKGWLIMSDYSKRGFVKCFFLNPVTDVRITIPSILSLPPTYRYSTGAIIPPPLSKMVASSKPNCDGSSESDCRHLVGLLSDSCHIAIYKFFEKSWTIVESNKNSVFIDVEIMGTKLYVIVPDSSFSDSIWVYCLKDSSINGPPKAKVLVKFPITSFLKWRSNYVLHFLCKDEALRELYFISVFCNIGQRYEKNKHFNGLEYLVECNEPPEVIDIEVIKLDTNKDPIVWQKNVQLEDRVAFVSNFSSIIMSRDEVNLMNKDLIRGGGGGNNNNNIIYFAFYIPYCPTNPWRGLQLGMFCLTDRSIKYFPMETLKHDPYDVPYRRPVWFVPSLL